MTVSEYCEKHGINPSQLAKRCGVSRSLAYNWFHGAEPRGRNLAKLEKGTDGEITVRGALRLDEPMPGKKRRTRRVAA